MVRWWKKGLKLAIVLGMFGMPATASSEESLPNRVRVIRAIAVVERTPGETLEHAALRARPIAAVANRFLLPIGTTLRIVDVEVRDVLPGSGAFQVISALQAEWSSRSDARDLVIGITNGIRNDGYFGVALPRTACQQRNAYATVAFLGSDPSSAERAGRTLAHELGHFLGASHDPKSKVEGGLFSLMHPAALALTGGFSEISLQEIESFSGSGRQGGSCFPEEEIGADKIEIGGPDTLRVVEGELLSERFSIEGRADEVVVTAAGLPASATFDVATNELAYRPMAGIAGGTERSFSFVLRAETFAARAEKRVEIAIVPGAPPAMVASSNRTDVTVGKNERFAFTFVLDGATPACGKAPKGVRATLSGNTLAIEGAVAKTTKLRCVGVSQGKKVKREIRLVVPPRRR